MLIVTIILLYPVIDHQASFCILPDNVEQAFPWMNKLAISLHKGYFPVWDANTFGGRSFAGETQTGIFYPLSIIYCFLFGSVNGIDQYYIDLFVVLHYFIALMGMYRVARMFGLTNLGSMVAASIYAFTGALAGRSAGETVIFYGMALLPWAAFCLLVYFKSNNKIYLVLTGAVLGLQILDGHFQPLFHTVIILVGIIAFDAYKKGRSLFSLLATASIFLAIIGFVAFVVGFPQLYYTHEYIATCYRHIAVFPLLKPGEKIPFFVYSHFFVKTFSDLPNLFHQEYIWETDSNTIYMGILPLALAVFYLLLYSRHKIAPEYRALTRLSLAICTIGVLAAAGYQTLFNPLLYQLPMVSVLCRQPARYIILISFGASLLAGLGFEHLKTIKEELVDPHRKKILMIGIILAINQLYLCFFEKESVPWEMSFTLLLFFAFMLIMTENSIANYLPAIAVGIIFIDLWTNPVGYRSVRDEHYPAVLYRRDKLIDFLEKSYGHYRVKVTPMANGAIARYNLGNVYSIQTDLGYGATENIAYMNFHNYPKLSESDIDDFLNIRYMLTNLHLDSSYRFLDSAGTWTLYERKNYYPRVYWKKQIGKRGAAIEEENKGKVRELVYEDLYQKYAVTCTSSDTLIFSENVYPGWSCYDNRRQIPITSAAIKDYPRIFRAIALDPGEHVIEFRYNQVLSRLFGLSSVGF
jgi:hypothetical protein